MLLRPLTPDDEAQMVALDQRCFAAGVAYSAAEIRAYARLPGFHRGCLAAGDMARLAGFILTVLERGRGHVITVDVEPEWRRQGLGEAMMRAAEQYYREAGARGMRLEAAVNNQPALALYMRLGYRIARTLPGYYADGLDGVRLALDF